MINLGKTTFDLERIRLSFALMENELGPDACCFIEQAFTLKRGTAKQWKQGRFSSWAEFAIFRMIIGRGWLVTEEWIKRFGHTCCEFEEKS